MSNLLQNMVSSDQLEEITDFGAGKQLFDTDVYHGAIKLAYITKSDSSNAIAFNLIIDIDGKEYTEAMYITNRDGLNFYEKDGAKKGLPGFNLITSMIKLYADESVELSDLDQQNKTIKLYDYTEKKEVNTEVTTFPQLVDLPVVIAIAKIAENKRKKVGNDYVSTNETVEKNNIEKFLEQLTYRTYTEVKQQITEAVWSSKWLELNKGKVINKVKEITATQKLSNSFGNIKTVEKQGKSLFPKQGDKPKSPFAK